MFERFTDKARKVVVVAKAKATDQGDNRVRPVHMLYGLAATDSLAAQALTALGVDAAAVEREIGRGAAPGPRDEAAAGDGEALAAIGIDLDEIKEVRALHHNYIGTEHVLLGLLRVADRYPRGDFATVTLPDLGLDPMAVRERVLAEIPRRHPRGR